MQQDPAIPTNAGNAADQERTPIVSAAISVGQSSGKVTGVEIHHLYVSAAADATAPSIHSVRTYLQAVKEQDRQAQVSNAAESLEQLQILWDQIFFVHPYGQAAGQSEEIGAQLSLLLYTNQSPSSVVILAETGTGKSAALKRIRSGTADNSLARLSAAADDEQATGLLQSKAIVIPIFMELRNLQGDVSALIASAYSRAADQPISAASATRLVNEYSCLLLFDGLDDLRAEHQLGGIQAIRQFVEGHPHTRHVFSCRISSYSAQLGRTTLLELDLLKPDQIRNVLGEQRYERLSPSLRYLASYRHLLEMLLRQQPDGKELSKGELIQQGLRHQYHFDQAKKPDTIRLVEHAAQWLAFHMQMDCATRITEQQVSEQLRAFMEVWREIRGWREVLSLVARSGLFEFDQRLARWHFHDGNTQAFFAAAAMAEHSELLAAALEQISDPLWAEPFEILAGICEDPSRLLLELADRDPRVAARCYSVARRPLQPSVRYALLDALIDALTHESAEGREDIALFLSRNQLTDAKRETERALLLALQREWRSGVIRALAHALLPVVEPIAPTDRMIVISRRLGDAQVRIKIVIRLWRAYIDGPDAQESMAAQQWREACLGLLKSMMRDRTEPELVRAIAAIALGAIGTDELRQYLLERWRSAARTELLGWCITESLAHFSNQPEEIRAAAQQIVNRTKSLQERTGRQRKQEPASPTSDPDHDVSADPMRERLLIWALYLLSYLGSRSEADELLLQLERALRPEARQSYMVRGYAAQAIGQLQPEKGKQVLQEALLHEHDLWVVRKIVQALGKLGTLDTIIVLEGYLRTGRVQVRKSVQLSIADIRRRYEGGR